jgi:glycosyltransferase involved in cell wall biosynthesis
VKLIFVNRFYHPDESATSLMLTDLVGGLAGLGAGRMVITGRSGYAPGAGSTLSELEGVHTIRLPSLPISNASLIGRAANFIAFYIGLLAAGFVHSKRGDLIICLTDPPLSNVIVRAIAAIKGAKVINWVQDIYPETATRLGFGNEQTRLIRMLAALRDRAWQFAHANVCIGERMRSMLADRGIPGGRIHVIQNWADDTALRPMHPSENSLRKEWGFAADEIVIGYSGNLGRAHDASTMLEAAERLGAEGASHLRFLFIGGGAKHELLKEKEADAHRTGTRIETRGYRERSELRESLSVPDIHWLSLEPQLEGLIVPSKFYGAVAVGRPIIFIGDLDGEVARLIARGQCGRSFEKGDVEGLVSYLRLLGADRSLRETLGGNARRFCEEKLTRQSRIGEWRTLIEQLAR